MEHDHAPKAWGAHACPAERVRDKTNIHVKSASCGRRPAAMFLPESWTRRRGRRETWRRQTGRGIASPSLAGWLPQGPQEGPCTEVL